MKNQTCCFTGHREIPAVNIFIKKRLKKEIERMVKNGVIFFGSGGALGFDALAALAVLELKKKYPQIKLIMVLPCKKQGKYWNEKDKQVYKYLLENTDKIVYTSEHYHRSCMHIRNRYLVDNSSFCIAYLNKVTGGTAYTVNYALKSGLKVINTAEK